MNIVHSVWDSKIFGRKVGQLYSEEPPSLQDIRSVGRDYDVVFVKVPTWADPAPDCEAVDHLYDMEVEKAPANPDGSVRLVEAGAKHIEIARYAFEDSRFLRDSKLKKKAPELYVRWMLKKRIYVLRASQRSAFLLATSDGDIRRIDLIAVQEHMRGCGLGRKLLAGVLKSRSFKTWRVRVSARNHRAIRFYEDAGFRISRVSTAYHVWIRKRGPE